MVVHAVAIGVLHWPPSCHSSHWHPEWSTNSDTIRLWNRDIPSNSTPSSLCEHSIRSNWNSLVNWSDASDSSDSHYIERTDWGHLESRTLQSLHSECRHRLDCNHHWQCTPRCSSDRAESFVVHSDADRRDPAECPVPVPCHRLVLVVYSAEQFVDSFPSSPGRTGSVSPFWTAQSTDFVARRMRREGMHSFADRTRRSFLDTLSSEDIAFPSSSTSCIRADMQPSDCIGAAGNIGDNMCFERVWASACSSPEREGP